MSQLRPAQPDDAPQLAEIFRGGFETFRDWAPEGWEPPADLHGADEIAAALRDPDTWGRVVDAEDGIAAYVTIKPATVTPGGEDRIPGLGHLWMLFVRREHWGAGHARRLLAAAVEEFRERGYEEARLVTPAGNERSRALYERNGWRAVSSALEPSLNGMRIVEYRLKLR